MTDLRFGPFTLNPLARQLRKADDLVPLPAKAFDLLLLMAHNPGRPLTKKELLRTVWVDTHVDESNLTQSISVLRKALGAEGEGILLTLPGVGYQFAGRVTEQPPAQTFLYPMTLETTESHLLLEEVTEERVRWWTSPLALTLASAGVLAMSLAGWLSWERYEDRVGGPPVQIVIAATDGTTGDEVLDRTLDTIFRSELAQSPFVTMLANSIVRDKLNQMEVKSDANLTPAMAREICERTGSQAVLHRSIARADGHYILAEEAENCVDGASLGTATREVARAEQLPAALKSEASELRHRLGESRRTIARFNAPLAPATTNSLEALKDYSEGKRLTSSGRFQEQADLLQKAVALDPRFAAAWADLSTLSLNAGDREKGQQYLQKAYDLRSNATEPTQLFITARYHGEVTGDLYESLRNYQSWIEIYPHQVQPWSGMTVVLRQLGRTSEQLRAAQRTFQILPGNISVNQSLADAQLRSGDFAAARATCASSISRGIDGDVLRYVCNRVGYLQHDTGLIAEQEAWVKEHPFSPFLLANKALYAQSHGQMAEAEKLFAQMVDAFRHLGQDESASGILAGAAEAYAYLGEPEAARRILLKSAPDSTDETHLFALAALGDLAGAEHGLRAQLASHPRSTLWNEWSAPILRGKELLTENKPSEALLALEPARRFDGKDLDAAYLRGLAEFRSGDLTRAESDFRKILAHPEINPEAFQGPLAQLQLARTLTLEGDKSAAAGAYRAFLSLWQHADPSQPLLLAAQSELDSITRNH